MCCGRQCDSQGCIFLQFGGLGGNLNSDFTETTLNRGGGGGGDGSINLFLFLSQLFEEFYHTELGKWG